jgi:hypothetical protein
MMVAVDLLKRLILWTGSEICESSSVWQEMPFQVIVHLPSSQMLHVGILNDTRQFKLVVAGVSELDVEASH